MIARSNLIWATRGRIWGFRFLLDAGFSDPLPAYERAFAGTGNVCPIWDHVGETVAARIVDPLGRRDSAGRVIPHEFVVLGEAAALVRGVDDARRHLWPLVETAYERIWDSTNSPSIGTIRFD
ncbi:hypothetical protein ACWDHH_14170 [Janibacter hoylei]